MNIRDLINNNLSRVKTMKNNNEYVIKCNDVKCVPMPTIKTNDKII